MTQKVKRVTTPRLNPPEHQIWTYKINWTFETVVSAAAIEGSSVDIEKYYAQEAWSLFLEDIRLPEIEIELTHLSRHLHLIRGITSLEGQETVAVAEQMLGKVFSKLNEMRQVGE